MKPKDNVDKVSERIALAIDRQTEKQEKEARFRQRLGTRLKTPPSKPQK